MIVVVITVDHVDATNTMRVFYALIILGCTLGCTAALTAVAQPTLYPPTRVDDVRDTIFGTVVADPYRWLEDDRDPEVEAWVDAQDRVARDYLSKIPFRNAIRQRLAQLYTYEKVYGADRLQGLTFFLRQRGTDNHALLIRRNAQMEEDTVLNPNTWSEKGTTRLGSWAISRDARYLAYARSDAGSDWQTIYVMDLATKQHLIDTVRWVKVSGISWHEDGFFYSRYPAPDGGSSELSSVNQGHMAMYHRVGTTQVSDDTVWTDDAHPDQFHFVWVPEGSAYMLRSSRAGGTKGTSLFYTSVDALDRNRQAPWQILFESDSVELSVVELRGDTLYAQSTEQAPNGKLIRVDNFTQPWVVREILPHSESVLQGVSIRGNKIIATVMRDVFDYTTVYDLDGNKLHEVELPGLGSVGGFGGRRENATVLYSFSSYTQPGITYEYNPATNTSTVWYASQIPFDASQVEARQVFVTSRDGTRVPMTLLQMKGRAVPGASPTMLYGYGGFNISISPSFNALVIPWLEAGGTWAIANLRGGGEYGEAWHEAGTTTRKQNVFDDAIACAQWLIDNGITTRDLLAINGRSNGGLLVGAVMTQRPDLFRVALPEVGVLDMLRYHLFTIGWNWARDYGTVAKEDQFRALLAYSPYHNVRPGTAYPATMVMTADHDDRVVPAHSFKFAAALQASVDPTAPITTSTTAPLLMRVERQSGHGAVNTETLLDGMADKLAFALYAMGWSYR